MCAQKDALKAKRDAACSLSFACLGMDVSQLRDARTLALLPQEPADFDALLKRLCEIE